MRDERGRPRVAAPGRATLSLAFLIVAAATPGASPAQTVRGYTQIQFQRFDFVGAETDRDLWLRTFQIDLSRRLAQRYDVTGQVYWNEVSTRGRPDRIRTPRGSLRLAHPVFGAWLSYRPVRTVDGLGLTTETDELQASGYFARAGLPALSGTWSRRTRETSTSEPNAPTVSWNMTAAQSFGPLALHGAWFDQTREAIAGAAPADERRNALAGAELRFGPRRATFLAQYNVNETKRLSSGRLTERSLLHATTLNGTSRFSRIADASVGYGFRRTLMRNGYRSDLDDHEGSAILNLRPRPALRFSGGGGVRTLRTVEENELQWYLLLLASAEGRVRPNWTGRAAVARSFNWTEGDRARPIDTYQASTSMRLGRGLDLSANGQVSMTDPTGRAQADSIGRNSRVVSQGGMLLTVVPLRRVTGGVSLQGYRSGSSLGRAVSTSRSSAFDLRWRPWTPLDLSGTLQRTRGLRRGDLTLTVWRGTAQWTPSRNLQLDGTYVRSDQPRGEAGSDLPAGHETYSTRALIGLSNEFRLQALWSLVDPGLPTRASRLELGVTLALRR